MRELFGYKKRQVLLLIFFWSLGGLGHSVDQNVRTLTARAQFVSRNLRTPYAGAQHGVRMQESSMREINFEPKFEEAPLRGRSTLCQNTKIPRERALV